MGGIEMSDTPRTDAAEYESQDEPVAKLGSVDVDLARQLERELNEANDRIKRLEEALAWYETKVSDCNRQGPEGDAARDALAKDYGRKAKEAKP
jgi:hypothetical protein